MASELDIEIQNRLIEALAERERLTALLLNAKEDILDKIRSFMAGAQREIYDDVRKFLQLQQANIGYVDVSGREKLQAALGVK